MSNKFRFLLPILVLSLVASGLASGCASQPAGKTDQELAMAHLEHMPAEVQRAPVVVQQAYQFTVANPDVLEQIPCYCGCGGIGHASNYACYVSGVDAIGTVQYDPHALGCSICVDITQDTMRLLRQGQGVPEIRAYVDATYAKYGPSNMP